MNLVDVNIVGMQAAETLVEFEKDSLTGQPSTIRLVTHGTVNFGGDDNGFAAGVCFQESSNNVFAFSTRINIGSVKEIDPEV